MTDSGVSPPTLRQAKARRHQEVETPITARVAIHHARAGEQPRFSYPVDVLRWRSCHAIVSGVFGPEVAGRSPIFRPGDVTAEFFWRARWWNVIAGYDAGTGALRGYYCNVAKTPRWQIEPAPVIAYTDLDLDIVVFPDGRIELHDEDEFVRYAAQFHYPARTVERARRTVDELTARIERRAHPFRFESLPALCTRLTIPLPMPEVRQSG
jgi:protein associated with RNAse G/E